MTSITNTSLANYYSLNDAKNAATTSGQASNPSLTTALAAVNGTQPSNTNAAGGSSYLLDLSDNAKNYLQSLSNTQNGTSNSAASSTDGVILTQKQQAKLTEILIKYKDAPYNDTSFKKIQDDLDAAGIGADSLAARSQVRKLNPTLIFLDALNGGDGAAGTAISSDAIKADATGYLKKVAKQWDTISTTSTLPAEDTTGA